MPKPDYEPLTDAEVKKLEKKVRKFMFCEMDNWPLTYNQQLRLFATLYAKSGKRSAEKRHHANMLTACFDRCVVGDNSPDDDSLHEWRKFIASGKDSPYPAPDRTGKRPSTMALMESVIYLRSQVRAKGGKS